MQEKNVKGSGGILITHHSSFSPTPFTERHGSAGTFIIHHLHPCLLTQCIQRNKCSMGTFSHSCIHPYSHLYMQRRVSDKEMFNMKISWLIRLH